jgi:hypothetical protein
MLPHLLRRLLLPQPVLRDGPRRVLHQPRRGDLLRDDVLRGRAEVLLRAAQALCAGGEYLLRADGLQSPNLALLRRLLLSERPRVYTHKLLRPG